MTTTCPDTLCGVPQPGRRLVLSGFAAHDGGMTTTGEHADRAVVSGRSAANPAVSRHLVTHLERFWPSRRMNAFDELCRGC